MIKPRFAALVIALTAVICTSSHATTYYVSATGNDANDGKTKATAWKSIDRGDDLGILTGGDTVLVAPGTYTPTAANEGIRAFQLLNCSGTQGNELTYKAEGPEVIINIGGSSAINAGILVKGNWSGTPHDIIIDGFEITGGPFGIMLSHGSSNITIKDCLIHNLTGTTAMWPSAAGIYVAYQTQAKCLGNVIYNVDTSGIGVSSGIWMQFSTGSLHTRNTIYNVGTGVSAPGGSIGSAFEVRGCNGTSIFNNTADNCQNLLRAWDTSTSTSVTNNIIHNIREYGLGCWDAAGTVTCEYNLYSNSVRYGPNTSAGKNELDADPKFVNATLHDYHLQVDSPAIDAGKDIGLPYLYVTPDRGAFEYDGSRVNCESIGTVRKLPAGTWITLSTLKTVTVGTGTFRDGSIFIEEPNRASGIKVMPRDGVTGVSSGDMVTIGGLLTTDSCGEKFIDATYLSTAGNNTIKAVGMNNRTAISATGLDVSGLLVRVYGKVTYLASDGSFVYIDDGSGLNDGSGHTGLRLDLSGSVTPIGIALDPPCYALVTGVSGKIWDGDKVIPIIRPRGDDDIISSYGTADEMNVAQRWVRSCFGPSPSRHAFSFIYNGQSSTTLLPNWTREYNSTEIDDNRTEHILTYTDPVKQLQIKCVAIEYHDFPATEWKLYFKNIGSTDTSIIENIQSLDTNINARSTSGDFTLYYSNGCIEGGALTEYQPQKTTVLGKLQFAPLNGRSAMGTLPYFNLASPGGSGVIMGVGWTGQWAASFTRESNSIVNAQAGMELTHLRLHPGEEIRSPASLLLFWSGTDRLRGHNLFRRLMLAHYTPTPGGTEIIPPVAASPYMTVPMGGETEKNMLQGIANIAEHSFPVDMWWIDAGWYDCGDNWSNIGTWEPDPTRFPNGLKPIVDAAHAAGMRLRVWFAPESAVSDSWLYTNHPDWFYPSTQGTIGNLLNLGNPSALQWVKDHIGGMISSSGIDNYGQDIGPGPLYAWWRNGEASDRQGINEIKHITALYDLWDYLQETHPNLLIDTLGARMDFEALRRAVVLWRSDYGYGWDPTGQQSMTYGLSYWIPITGVGCITPNAYDLRSGMGSFMNLMFNYYNEPLTWVNCPTPVSQYKTIRHLFRGDFYPLTEYNTSNDVWMAWQYDRPNIGEGMLQAFRRSGSTVGSVSYKLNGLNPTSYYKITCWDKSPYWYITRTGSQLMTSGLQISLTAPGSTVYIYKRLN